VANPEEEAVEDDGDISEPDIDSIAGQIAMLKGQKVRNADEEHDDDSDSDADTSDSEDDTPRKGNRDSDSDSDSD
jgi:translocation protein SEC63